MEPLARTVSSLGPRLAAPSRRFTHKEVGKQIERMCCWACRSLCPHEAATPGFLPWPSPAGRALLANVECMPSVGRYVDRLELLFSPVVPHFFWMLPRCSTRMTYIPPLDVR